MKTTMIALAIFLLSLPSLLPAQQDTTWQRWNWLIGDWVGEGSGKPGQGSGGFSLQPDLDKKILVRRSHSEYPATTTKPEIIHDDLMIVYLDNAGHPDKAMYFDNENHTIHYTITYLDKAIIFTSSKERNMPVFRLTYIVEGKDRIDVKFEMSTNGETFQTYTEGTCTRKK